MKKYILFGFIPLLLVSCEGSKSMSYPTETPFYGVMGGVAESYRTAAYNKPMEITQSLFADNKSTISEENIQKILNGTYKLPDTLRVAMVELRNTQEIHNYYYSINETYLKAQQSYVDLLSKELKTSPRVKRVSVIPKILISDTPTFTNIREAAVRTQADVVAIYNISSDIYSKYKVFSSTEIKAFATTQFILLDVRTGLIPFSTIITKDYLSQKQNTDMNVQEAIDRVKSEAVLLTLNDIGEQLTEFLLK